MRGNLRSAVQALACPSIQAQSTPEVTQVWSAVPFPIFNIVAHAATADAARVLAPYKQNSTPAIWFCLSASPAETPEEALLAAGLTLIDVRPCMAADSASITVKNTDVDIVRVQNDAQCRDWAAIQSAANGGFPPIVLDTYEQLLRASLHADSTLTAFVAYADRLPVACALLHGGGGAAGIYQVGTIPAVRRRGYGTAVTAAAVLYAEKRGYDVSVLIATQMGRSVYEKMGFQTFMWANVYLFSAQTGGAAHPSH